METKWKIYKKALDSWGLPFQIIMLGEEQAELFKVVSKLNRKKSNILLEDLAEEIADCEIMMEQMQVAFGVSRYLIDKWKQEKLENLERLVKFRKILKQEKSE